jgi:predicted Ser/Thr protein kinase
MEELGQGGMGMVYKARQLKLDRLVALKVLPPETAGDPAFAERFGREARALAKLNHPNIVTVHDFGQAEGQSFFIMEYVDGANLRQRLRKERLAPPETFRIVAQVCDALQYAHDEGIAHRDIKPENILLDQKGRVKIADFGIAKLLARKTVEYTLTGPWQVMGTLNYMAPEQLENPLAVDHRADVYSLGVVFYEMLTGELPLGRFALPSQKAPVDARLDEIVTRAMEREPGRRYQQVSELGAALAALAAPTSPRPTESKTAPMGPDVRAPATASPPAAERAVLVAILVVCCLLCWPVGLVLSVPAAIWLWLTLRQPDGKRVFRRRILKAESHLQAAGKYSLVTVLGNTTGWAILVCLIGLPASLQPFLPVADLQILGNLGRLNQAYTLTSVYAYDSLFGLVPAGIFLVLLLLLIASGSRKTRPIWQPDVLLLAGTGVLLFAISLLVGRLSYQSHAPPRNDGNTSRGDGRVSVLGKDLPLTYSLETVPVAWGQLQARGQIEVAGEHNTVSLHPGSDLTRTIPNNLRVAVRPLAYVNPVLSILLLLLGALQIRTRRATRPNGAPTPR